ncbi:SDR family oxidoreductase [Streptomyces sp. NPDC005004]
MLEGARERRIRTGGIELCVAELGDTARPTVVLVHGYPDSKEVWSEVAVRLARDFHVVLYDVRGHGRSTAPKPLRGGFTLAKLTDDFLAVVDAVSPDRPVHLVGHDWGSVQSWEFVTVARTRGRVASFTSVSGPSLDHFGHWINARVKRPTPRRIGQLLGQGAKSWYVYLLHTPVLPELAWRGPLGKRWPALLQRSEKVPADGYPTASLPSDAAHGAWLYRDNVRTRLRRPRPDAHAHVPVQLVTPEGDAFLSPRLYDDLEQWVPRLVRRVLPARHWIPRTRPDQLALWITEFAESVEKGAPAAEPEGRHGDRFAGQLVLITGAGDGIGRATAFAFAEAGARVVAVDRDPAAAARTAELARLLGASGSWAESVDVSDEQAVEKLASRVHGEHGVVDVLVNGAGVDLPDSLLTAPADDWRAALEANVFGALHSCRLFGAHMVSRGQGGHIVNIGSTVTDLSDRLRAELSMRDIGVTVVAAAPGANWPPEKAANTILDAVAQNRPTVLKRASVVHRIANFFVDN